MRDYIGYLASVLVLCTFCARTMIPLRAIALASNVAFLAYGGLLHLYPVLLLHAVLMPVNVWRLAEIFRLRGHVRKSTGGDAVFTALLPFATRLTVPQGEVVIRKGEQSDCLYLVFEGALWVADAEVELGPGSVVGEMGVLSDTHLRTASVSALR
jgi:CRP/FNR family cyclic AMP-dependent transcriptional regulator